MGEKAGKVLVNYQSTVGYGELFFTITNYQYRYSSVRSGYPALSVVGAPLVVCRRYDLYMV